MSKKKAPLGTCNACLILDALTKVKKQYKRRSVWYLCVECWDKYLAEGLFWV